MIKENLNIIRKTIPENVKLVAVSKTKPNEFIKEAYDCGQRVFGENKAQELAGKAQALPKDIEWHFIGHLQTNKVKYIAPYVSLIHSIDSLKLLTEVNKQALKNNRTIDCLLQFHIATEESKFGLSLTEAIALLSSDEFASFQNIRIIGVMGMASFVDDINQVRQEFKNLFDLFSSLKQSYINDQNSFTEISMGMSGDYQIAIDEGATIVRVGSSIFGSRF